MLAQALALMFAAAAPPDAASSPPPSATVSPLEVLKHPEKPPAPDAKADIANSGDDADTRFVFWPATNAYQARYDGRVTLRCLVDAHGLAERCEVASESPAGLGFGQAALEARPTLKLKPPQGPDGPVSGVLNIAIQFTAPQFAQDHNMILNKPLPMKSVTMLDYPVWSAAPSFDDLAAAYPQKAEGREGYAVLRCVVLPSGELHRCGVIKEDPDKAEFGKAALSLTPKFKVAASLATPRHHSELWVNIPIRFPPRAGLAERTVTAPAWIDSFDQKHVPRLFPPEAVANGVTSGRGVARCRVGADGALTDCQPERGSPDGLGFSEAAVKLASAMRMNLWSADAGPVEGGVIYIPIRLNLKNSVD